MTIGPDRVQALKQESSALGGDAAEDVVYPAAIQPQEDALECAGVYLQDAGARDETVYLERNSGAIRLRDQAHTSPVELSSLAKGTISHESLALATTTSSSAQVKTTWTTPALAAGTYLLLWSFTAVGSTASTSTASEVRVGGVVLASMIDTTTRAGDANANAGHVVLPSISGVQTIDVRYRRPAGGGTAGVRDVRLALWRIG